MDVPEDTLRVLQCSSCEAVLSRGPVFQTSDGAALCGCCVTPNIQASRCLIYEAAATLLRFPCRNQSLGCKETVPFLAEKEVTAHEATCIHRQHLCPVVPAGHCDWLGSRNNMLQHCSRQHPNMVLHNSAQLTHNIMSSSLHTFLFDAFHVLFILHIKVCVTSGKIYHAVRYLGDPSKAAKFSFTVDVKRGKQSISKSGSVAPQGCLAIQEDTSMPISINSLLEILGGFDETTFTVTIWDMTGCGECCADLSQYFYPRTNGNGWLCENCAPVSRTACSHQSQGCMHMDIKDRFDIHNKYFCSYTKRCQICNNTIPKKYTLIEHYGYRHRDITVESGAVWQIERILGQRRLITTDFGLVVVRTWPDENFINFFISSPLTIDRLHEISCEIQVTDPRTGDSVSYQPEISFTAEQDCQLKITKNDFPSYNGQCYVSVTINRVNPE